MNTIAASAQELHLVVKDKPLNDVLRSLHVELSFDDNALSKYRITINRQFGNAEQAISFLLKDKPFQYEKINGVYVISPSVKPVQTILPVIEEKKYVNDTEYYSTTYTYDVYGNIASITTPDELVSTIVTTVVNGESVYYKQKLFPPHPAGNDALTVPVEKEYDCWGRIIKNSTLYNDNSPDYERFEYDEYGRLEGCRDPDVGG